MADLIKREDVNEVIDALEVYTVGRMNTEKVQISVLQLQRLINALKNIPTAYDVEAVVAELEKIKKVSACDEIRCDECKYTKICFEGEKSYKVALDRAISIVRGKE